MIKITDSAANHIRQSLEKRGKGIGIRIGVKGSGCSGLSYILEFCDSIYDGDAIFANNRAQVVIDAKSIPYLDGMELDYTKEGLKEGFKFNNPNVKDQCGCGESFTV